MRGILGSSLSSPRCRSYFQLYTTKCSVRYSSPGVYQKFSMFPFNFKSQQKKRVSISSQGSRENSWLCCHGFIMPPQQLRSRSLLFPSDEDRNPSNVHFPYNSYIGPSLILIFLLPQRWIYILPLVAKVVEISSYYCYHYLSISSLGHGLGFHFLKTHSEISLLILSFLPMPLVFANLLLYMRMTEKGRQ